MGRRRQVAARIASTDHLVATEGKINTELEEQEGNDGQEGLHHRLINQSLLPFWSGATKA